MDEKISALPTLTEIRKTTLINALNSGINGNIIVGDLTDFVNVKWYGAKGDGLTDDTLAIQTAIDENDSIYIPDGNYLIAGTINIKGGILDVVNGSNRLLDRKIVVLSYRARILQSINADLIVVKGSGSVIRGGILDVSMVGLSYTSNALLLDANDTDGPCTWNDIKDIEIYQANTVQKGTAIRLKSSGSAHLSYNKITGYSIYYFYYGLYLQTISTGWISNNSFDGNIDDSQQLIYANGGGNLFRGLCQTPPLDPQNPELAAIYIDGGYNLFDCMVYDAGNTGWVKYAYEFSLTSYSNTISIKGLLKSPETIHRSNNIVGETNTLIDETNGHRYRLVSNNGVLSLFDENAV